MKSKMWTHRAQYYDTHWSPDRNIMTSLGSKFVEGAVRQRCDVDTALAFARVMTTDMQPAMDPLHVVSVVYSMQAPDGATFDLMRLDRRDAAALREVIAKHSPTFTRVAFTDKRHPEAVAVRRLQTAGASRVIPMVSPRDGTMMLVPQVVALGGGSRTMTMTRTADGGPPDDDPDFDVGGDDDDDDDERYARLRHWAHRLGMSDTSSRADVLQAMMEHRPPFGSDDLDCTVRRVVYTLQPDRLMKHTHYAFENAEDGVDEPYTAWQISSTTARDIRQIVERHRKRSTKVGGVHAIVTQEDGQFLVYVFGKHHKKQTLYLVQCTNNDMSWATQTQILHRDGGKSALQKSKWVIMTLRQKQTDYKTGDPTKESPLRVLQHLRRQELASVQAAAEEKFFAVPKRWQRVARGSPAHRRRIAFEAARAQRARMPKRTVPPPPPALTLDINAKTGRKGAIADWHGVKDARNARRERKAAAVTEYTMPSRRHAFSDPHDVLRARRKRELMVESAPPTPPQSPDVIQPTRGKVGRSESSRRGLGRLSWGEVQKLFAVVCEPHPSATHTKRVEQLWRQATGRSTFPKKLAHRDACGEIAAIIAAESSGAIM